MKYVCFGTASQFSPYDRLFKLLPDFKELLMIPKISPSILDVLDPHETVALVFHPFWIQTVNRFAPMWIVSFIEPCPQDVDPVFWEKLWNFLGAQSDLVCTSSERIYLEQSFRRDFVILLQSEEQKPFDIFQTKDTVLFLRDDEMFFRNSMERVLLNRPGKDLVEHQWKLRRQYYLSLVDQVNMQETVLFLLSVYQYLLGEKEARDSLLQSFEQSLLAGNKDCLTTHYRFLSAIEAQAGDLEQAVNTYGITAILPNEKETYQSLLSLLRQGKSDLVRADLFRLNEDYRSAALALSAISSDEGRRLLIQIYLHRGELEKSLRLIQLSDLVSVRDRRDYFLLKGTVLLMNGDRYGAIHHFLKAALYDYEAIAHVLELQTLEQGLLGLVKKEAVN